MSLYKIILSEMYTLASSGEDMVRFHILSSFPPLFRVSLQKCGDLERHRSPVECVNFLGWQQGILEESRQLSSTGAGQPIFSADLMDLRYTAQSQGRRGGHFQRESGFCSSLVGFV